MKKVRVIDYFLGNQGIKTLVRDLYSSQFGRPAYLASWSGTPDTKRSNIVITIQEIIPKSEYGMEMNEIPSQNILSPK